MINNPFEVKKKEEYETAFETFLKEAEVKAEEKKKPEQLGKDYPQKNSDPWRKQKESLKQEKYLNSLGFPEQDKYDDMTKGEASDLIEKYKDWSELKNFYANVDRDKNDTRSKLPHKILIIDPNEYDSMEELIFSSKDKKLTHLILDGKEKNPDFLNQVYFNEGALPYLEKVYDSSELGYNYHVKIFKINF